MKNKFITYGTAHLRANLASLGKILRSPFISFMTIAVIGTALALPTVFYVMLQNTQILSKNWQHNSTQIAVYLKTNLSSVQTQDILHQLRTNPDISNIEYISPNQGLKEFADALNNQKAISSLHHNPLPGLVLVQPIFSLHSQIGLSRLIDNLKKLPEIENVQLNLIWLQRLNNIINLVRHIIYGIGLLLGLGILLIVGNSIRHVIQNERQEISILKLVGATNSFIRRPFLYSGLWYGFFSGIIALILTILFLKLLQAPAAALANSYNCNFYMHGLTSAAIYSLLIISMLLGLIGSWIVITKELRNN